MAFFMVSFERSDAYTVWLLNHHNGGFYRRTPMGADYTLFSLLDEDWGECGMILLRRVGETSCEVTHFRPPLVTVDEAVHFFMAFRRRQVKAYEKRRLAENPALSQEELLTESMAMANLDLRVEYRDFPDVGQARLRAYVMDAKLDKEWDWDWFTPVLQSYLGTKRLGLLQFITKHHTQGLVDLQNIALAEADSVKSAPPVSRSGPRAVDAEVKEKIIAEWIKARGSMNQEVFCSSKGIGASTLRSWIRERGNRQVRPESDDSGRT